MIALTGADGIHGRQLRDNLLQHLPAHSVTEHQEGTDFRGADKFLLLSGFGPERVKFAPYRTAIAAAVEAGVKHLYFASVLGADGYCRTGVHAYIEYLVRESGLAYTLLRSYAFTEYFTALLPDALDEGTLTTSAGEGRIASPSLSDLAAAIATVLTQPGHEGRTYELTGDRAWTFDEFAAEAARTAGRPLVHRNADENALRVLLRQRGMPTLELERTLYQFRLARIGTLGYLSTDLTDLLSAPQTVLDV